MCSVRLLPRRTRRRPFAVTAAFRKVDFFKIRDDAVLLYGTIIGRLWNIGPGQLALTISISKFNVVLVILHDTNGDWKKWSVPERLCSGSYHLYTQRPRRCLSIKEYRWKKMVHGFESFLLAYTTVCFRMWSLTYEFLE